MEEYPAYKDSKLEWVGRIPAHWSELKLKFISDIRPSNVDKHSIEGESKVKLCNYVDVYYHEHIDDSLDFMEATASDQQIARFKLQDNDVIITKDSEDASDIAVPALIKGEFDNVICGYHLALIRPDQKKVYGNFLFYQFLADGVRDQFNVAAKGVTRCGLPKQALFDSIIPLPPLEEQKAIADFLDERTRKIDELIEAKQKLLDLLEEKRRALITRAVTRGLDPDVPMMDSGVEWLGEVPEHWEVDKFSHHFFSGMGETIIKENLDQDGMYPVYSATEMGTIFGYLKQIQLKLYQGDIVIPARGVSIGHPLFVEETATSTQTTIYLKPFSKSIYPKYAYYFMKGNRKHLFYYDETAIPQITVYQVKANPLLLPPLQEQKVIADFLEEQTSKIDKIRLETKKAMERLKEYRGALVSTMITGKYKQKTKGNGN